MGPEKCLYPGYTLPHPKADFRRDGKNILRVVVPSEWGKRVGGKCHKGPG